MSNPTSNDRAQEGAGIRKMKVGSHTAYMLPEVMIQLSIELGQNAAYHQELLDYVARVAEATGPKADWITKLSAIAAHVGILMDGTYDAEALNKVAEKCLEELRARRVLTVGGV